MPEAELFETHQTPSNYTSRTTLVHAPLVKWQRASAQHFTHRGGKINGAEEMQPLGHRIAIEPLLLVHF